MTNRRIFLTQTAATLACPWVIASAHAGPQFLLGFFARAGIGRLARTGAQQIGKTMIQRNLASRSITGRTRQRADNARSTMSNSRYEFIRPEMMFAGRLSQRAISKLLRRGFSTKEIAAVTNSNPTYKAFCTGYVSDSGKKGPAFMENAEIATVASSMKDVAEHSNDPFDQFGALYPLETVDAGEFRYDEGHRRPRIFKSAYGNIVIESELKGRGAVGRLFFENITGPLDSFEHETPFVERA